MENKIVLSVTEEKFLHTYEEVLEFSKGHQVNLQQIISQRLPSENKDWTDVFIVATLRSKIANEVSQLLGGRQATQDDVDRNLYFNTPHHWGLKRIILEQHGDNPPRWVYIAGQDHTAEIRTIRNYLKK